MSHNTKSLKVKSLKSPKSKESECDHVFGAYIPPESENGGLVGAIDVDFYRRLSPNYFYEFDYCPKCGKKLAE